MAPTLERRHAPRMPPTPGEVLRVLTGLGYHKPTEAAPADRIT